MGSRYRDRNYEGNDPERRRQRGSGFGPERGRFGSPRFGGSRFGNAPGQDEAYFGGSRQMGEGNPPEFERDYDTYPRDFEGGYGSNRSYGNIPMEGRRHEEREFGGYDVDQPRRRFRGPGSRSPYDQELYGREAYGSHFPGSEQGFMSEHHYDEGERGWWDKASDEVSSWLGDEQAARRRRMDERNEGRFRGRGPRNYTRSDERIKEDVNDRLTDYSYIDASDIEVEVSNGTVILSGRVDSRYDKRMAEDVADGVSGVKNVENRIRVEAAPHTEAEREGWSYSDTAGHTETGGTSTGTTATGTTSRGKSAG